MNDYIYRIIRFKTEKELLDSGWEIINDKHVYMRYRYDNNSHFIDNFMKKFFGKVLVIKTTKYIYRDGWIFHTCKSINQTNDNYTITENMIAEELKIEDYPEFFI